MKFGFVLPFGDARFTAECARRAEEAGWDGFFTWESVWGVDAWVSLSAAAMLTDNIRLGTLLSPLPVLSPWKLASETATLDNLCGGRLILSVGLGAPETGFGNFGLPVDRKTRVERLDESLAILTGLWKGQPFQFEGRHFHIQPTDVNLPTPPLQRPRIPIWMVGAWPRERSLQRALRYDGLVPNFMGADGKVEMGLPQAEIIRDMMKYVRSHTAERAYDVILEGETDLEDDESLKKVRDFASLGITWWIEARWSAKDP